MRINICFRSIENKLIKLEDIDSSFIWDSDYIPIVGDSIDYTLKKTPVDFTGSVIKRTFYPDSTVLLEVECPKYVLNNLATFFSTKNNE
jgi:hypothetical protein